MQIVILPKNDLTSDQTQAVNTLRKAVYPPDGMADVPVRPIAWAEKTWSVLIWDNDDNLVSYIGALTRQATLNGRSVLMGGIGSVKTHPSARGRGYASGGLTQAAKFLVDQFKVDFSVLFCRKELLSYYQRLDWRVFEGDLIIAERSEKVKFTLNETMILNGRHVVPQHGILDICGMPW